MSSLKEALLKQQDKGQALEIKPSYAMKQLMIKMKGEIQSALPLQLSSERFQRVALTAFNSNPKLQNCEARSFIAAMMQSAQLGSGKTHLCTAIANKLMTNVVGVI